MSTLREGHTATLLPSGEVLVAGGLGTNYLPSAELYDPRTRSWRPVASMKKSRVGHTATLLTNGQVLVAGGFDGTSGNLLSSSEIFDPTNGTWADAGSMSTVRGQQTATLLQDSRVLIVGGDHLISQAITNVDLYDPAVGWAPAQFLNNARFRHTATLLSDGTVLVTGGSVAGKAINTVEVFSNGRWAFTNGLSTPRAGHSATLLPDGRVLVASGSTTNGQVASSEVFDPMSGSWTPAGNLHDAREDHTALLLTNGITLVIGGDYYVGGGPVMLPWAEVWEPTGGRWRQISQLNTPRIWHTATLLPDGTVLVLGGYNTQEGYLSSAEIYIDQPPPIVIGSVTSTSNAVTLGFTNLPGSVNRIVASSNLELTASQWIAIGTATEVLPGQFQFTDSVAGGSSSRFYRVRW